MIQHKIGDLFEGDSDIIVHQVNCRGAMGSGVAKQVRARYPNVYKVYCRHCADYHARGESPLGEALLVKAEPDSENSVWVANLFAQDGYGYGERHTDYEALWSSLHVLRNYCLSLQSLRPKDERGNPAPVKIGIPFKMSCDRGGGDWEGRVYPMIEEILGDLDVTLYELPKDEERSTR